MRVSRTLKAASLVAGWCFWAGVILTLVACQPATPSSTPPLLPPPDHPTSAPALISSATPQSAETPTNPATTIPRPSYPTIQPSRSPSSRPLRPPRPSAPTPPTPAVYAYTHQRADGNRLVSGHARLPDVESMDLPLAGVPRWVVAAPADDATIWAVVLNDGSVQAFRVVGKAVEAIDIQPDRLPAGMPPLLQVKEGVASLITAPSSAASEMTHPVPLDKTGRLAYIEAGGDLVVWEAGHELARLALNALPDARLLADEAGRLLLLTDATTRYGHGVLGDRVESASITLVETEPEPRVALSIPIPDPAVVEGIAPIWTDLDGDGTREIIVTVSDASQGARIVVFNQAGERIAAGPAIGLGRRWRHQLAVAPFGPAGELELADVLTPHIGGVVEFYRLVGDRLRIVAQEPGYTSHVIGTRNLDMAVAGDVDGDGRVELLLPDQARTQLGAIRRTAEGASVAWTVPAGGRIVTNLAVVALPDRTLVAGVGREDGVLRLWLPSQER